jgi:hypothetical protein
MYELDAFTEDARVAKEAIRDRIWTLYADLKGYACVPTPVAKVELATRFDAIVTTTTGFVTLDRLLGRLHARKAKLLMVLERPDVPFTPTRQKTTSAPTSPGARSPAAPARVPAATAAISSSD